MNLGIVGVIFVVTLFSTTQSMRILTLEFFGSKSHVLTYLPLLEELSKRGHNVTLAGPVKGVASKGIREITTTDLMLFIKEVGLSIYDAKEAEDTSNPFTMLAELSPKFCRELYDRADIRGLLEESFDLVILQPLFCECSLGLVHRIMTKNNAPLILFSTTSAPNSMVRPLGGHHPPSFVPNFMLGFKEEMPLGERIQNFVFEGLMNAVISYQYLPVVEKVYREELGQDIPSAKEILGSASLILSNGHFSISKPKPNLPNVVDIGGLHSRPAKPLPKDLADFIAEGGDDGFILFSLGSNLQGSEMPVEKRDLFVSAFGKLKQRVIWKFESESIPNLPKNVKLVKWIPQQDLLGHSKIQLFITHCGLGGIEESIYHGVPLVGMPFFGDQPLNAKEAANNGFLLQLEWNDLTEESLLRGISEVLNNPSYRRNVQELSFVFRDQIDSPLERAVWWTEYIVRHKGAPRLQSVARKLNFIQFHSLDVIGILLAVAITAIYVVVKTIKFVISKFIVTKTKRE